MKDLSEKNTVDNIQDPGHVTASLLHTLGYSDSDIVTAMSEYNNQH